MIVCIEGIDGAGTTSVSKSVVKELENIGIPAIWTHEPSDGPIGLLLRQVLKGDLKLDKRATLGLFIADRWWHIEHVIKPALEEGKVVVSDRFAYSTHCYQSDSWKPSIIRELMSGVIAPDLVFILDCPVREAQKRKTPEKELFDDADAQSRYRSRYHNLVAFGTFRLGHEKFILIDALENTQEEVVKKVTKGILEERK